MIVLHHNRSQHVYFKKNHSCQSTGLYAHNITSKHAKSRRQLSSVTLIMCLICCRVRGSKAKRHVLISLLVMK